MEITLRIVYQMISLFFMAFIGFALGRLKILNATVNKGIANLLAYGILPCMVISSMQVPFSRQLLLHMGTISVCFLLSLLLGFLSCLPLVLRRRPPLAEAGLWLSCAAFPNSLYVGKPLLTALYGEGMLFAVTAQMFVFTISCFTIGAALVALGGGGGRLGLGGTLKKLLRNPCILACGAGFLFFALSIRLPAPLLDGMTQLAGAVVPLSMLMIGFSFSQARLPEVLGDYRVYLLSALRLLACPVLTFLVCRLFVRDPLILGAVTVFAACPMSANIGVLSEQYGNNPVFCSKLIMMTTLLCAVTVPLLVVVLGL